MNSGPFYRLAVGSYTAHGAFPGPQLGDGVAAITPLPNMLNPSYLTVSRDRRTIYAVGETDTGPGGTGWLYSCRYDGDARDIHLTGWAGTGGADPCHLCVDRDNRFVFVANYNGGVSMHRIGEGGIPSDPVWVETLEGSGPVASRQEASHPHQVMIVDGGTTLLVTDLGSDRVNAYGVDPQGARLEWKPGASWVAPSGMGPRHGAVAGDGKSVYLVGELDARLVRIERGTDRTSPWRLRERVDLPGKGRRYPSAIRLTPDERHLYVASRGDDVIHHYRVNEDRSLKYGGSVVAGGRWPREFIITHDGRTMIVANQHSNQLTFLDRDPDSGTLAAVSRRIAYQAPASILELEE